MSSSFRLIVGLGNPENKYALTRHNLGFMVVRYLGQKLKADFRRSSFLEAMMAKAKIDRWEVGLFLPLTYVNRSGVAVKKMVVRKKLEEGNILVICDDLNLDFGQIRLRAQGSHGGHNGLSSITESLGSEKFPRLRMGIGHLRSKGQMADYVLEEFSPQEKARLDEFIQKAAECCLVWVKENMNKAMEQFNRRK